MTILHANLISTTYLERGKIPIYFDSEREAIFAAFKTLSKTIDSLRIAIIENKKLRGCRSNGCYCSFGELPLTLRVEDLMPILGVGRNTAYELVRSGQIRSIKVGRQLRIPKQALIDYLTASHS